MNSQKRDSVRCALFVVIMVVLLTTTLTKEVRAQNTNTFPNTGNAGIGTTTPSYPLEINTTTNATVMNVTSSASADWGIRFDSSKAWIGFKGFAVNGGGVNDFGIAAGSSGNLLFGTNGGNEVMRLTSGGKVGIGTASPSFKLHVFGASDNQLKLDNDGSTYTSLYWANNGTIKGQAYYNVSTNQFRLGGSGANTVTVFTANTDIERMRIDANGNVGIGTTSPSYNLHVTGSFAWGTAGATRSYAGAATKLFAYADSNSNVLYSGGSGGFGINNAADSERLVQITDGGNVGIGIFNPGSYKLNVNGTINATGLNINGSPVTGSQWSSGSGSINYTSGNVGIGTTTPGSKLDVNGNVYVRDLVGTGTQHLLYGYLNGAGRMIADLYSRDQVGVLDLSLGDGSISTRINGYGHSYFTGGNVGIGTSSPTRQLTLSGATQTDLALISQDQGTSVTDGFNLQQSGVNTNLINREAGSMAFWTNATQQVTILSTGKVGIGTSNPGSTLDVSGTINVGGAGNITAAGTIEAGNIKAKYQDVAEWVPASEQLAAGTVVVLDSTKSNQVTSSTVSYDTRVAGVISEQPGIALGEKGESKVLVATTGRVRVKVDASKSPIHIGDLLVTSDVLGMAMKSEPVEFAGRKMHMPGTLIGKALEPLAKGSGEILVLLSLQ